MKKTTIWALFTAFIAGLLLSLCNPPQSQAGTPLYVTDEGTPYRWDTSKNIVWSPDLGKLGKYSNAEAINLVKEAFDAWEDVEGSALKFTQGEPLDVNVTGSAGGRYLYMCEGVSPIIFDSDGSLVEALFGPGSSCYILGFAAPQCTDDETGEITEGVAVINGRFVDGSNDGCEVSEDELLLTMGHELGHMLNLGHAQVNGNQVSLSRPVTGYENQGIPPLNSVELMYPFLLPGTKSSLLAQNDRAWITWLYPDAQVDNQGGISGEMQSADGNSPLQGANLIARNPEDPFFDAVAAVSGFLSNQSSGPQSLKGYYELPGLNDGAAYSVGAEEVNPNFISGSSVPPLDPPKDINTQLALAFLEFYNGSNEMGTYPPDNPLNFTTVAVNAGQITTGISLDLNYDRVESPGCTQDSECGGGLICEGEICIYGCRSDASCQSDEICTEDFSCETGCRLDDDCGNGQICEDNACLTGCRGDLDCPTAQVCEDEACIPGCRGDEGCPSGQICEDEFCTPGCRDQGDCQNGQRCEDNLCVTGCDGDEGCPSGEICEAEICIPGCRGDEQCGNGQICLDESCVYGCRDAADCAPGYLCVDTLCQAPITPTPIATPTQPPGEETPTAPKDETPTTFDTPPVEATPTAVSITPTVRPNTPTAPEGQNTPEPTAPPAQNATPTSTPKSTSGGSTLNNPSSQGCDCASATDGLPLPALTLLLFWGWRRKGKPFSLARIKDLDAP